MKVKEKIKELLKEVDSKQWPARLKSNPEILQELVEYTRLYNPKTIGEMVYIVLVNPPEKLACGKYPSYISFNYGYRKFCGKANVCDCAKKSVSEKVSNSKHSYSEEKKILIQSKRVATSLEKYGVTNNAQIEKAKQKHKEFYNSIENIQQAVKKGKTTRFQKYGNENYNNIEKVKDTYNQRYGRDYWCARYNNENLSIISDKEKLTDLYLNYSVPEISEMLSIHVQTVYKWLNAFELREPFNSSEEFEVVKFLKSLGITNIIENTRKLLPSGKEIDIYLPDYNLAIEYNGIYWHNESVSYMTRAYHSDKFYQCEKLGIQLLTIFSPFWKNKKQIVENSIKSKLGLCVNKIYARKCDIVKIQSKDVRNFLDTNHIQGYTNSSIVYGLVYNNELVSVMTFGLPRIGIGKKNEVGYELIRFATSSRVVGAAGKLLKNFIREHKPEYIFSYSDNEWSNGSVYKQLGFQLEKEINPSYWYVHPKEEIFRHRFNYSKQKLVEKGYSKEMTEREITLEMGLLKVWDCGKRRWGIKL